MRYLRPVFVLTLVLGLTAPALCQSFNDALRNNKAVIAAFHDVVAKPREYTVRVLADGKDVAFGTIIEADGWIITKASEIPANAKVTVKLNNGSTDAVEAKIIGVHADYDLAMLKIEASDLPTVEWRHSKEATVGRWVASVGLGSDPAAIGVVSVAKRKLVLGDQPPKVAMNPNTAYLGVGLEAGMPGAKVTQVNAGTPAAKAGLKANDIIFELAGKPIADDEVLRNNIQRLKAGDTIVLKVRRGDEEIELKATLGKMDPKMLGNPQERMGSILSARRGGFPTILQHDTVLRPQDCGGPLVDLDGKTVGINIARAGRTESYAIPSEDVQALIPDLKSGKLAVKVNPVDPKVNPKTDGTAILDAKGTITKDDMTSKLRQGRFNKVHEVPMTGGTTYIIEMKSSELDPFVTVEDAKGNKLAEAGSGIFTTRLVFQAPSDGTFRVVASSFLAGETGAYTITVRKQ